MGFRVFLRVHGLQETGLGRLTGKPVPSYYLVLVVRALMRRKGGLSDMF